jgi:hypothetical protein
MKAIIFINEEAPDKNGNRVDIDGLSFPPVVPVRLGFTGVEIGTAKPRREGNQIVAELKIPRISGKLFPAIGYRALDSYQSISCSIIVSKAELIEVSLCEKNADERIPPLDFSQYGKDEASHE